MYSETSLIDQPEKDKRSRKYINGTWPEYMVEPALSGFKDLRKEKRRTRLGYLTLALALLGGAYISYF